jgi:hypothetical protein
MISSLLENSVLKFVVDNIVKTVEDINGVKNVVDIKTVHGTMLVLTNSVMITVCLKIRF